MTIDRYRLIGCNVLQTEVETAINDLGADIDCTWLELGLHDDVDRMRAAIQHELDMVAPAVDYAAILLVYGLCSRGTAGLRAGAVPLVMPRCHDCVSLFLGSAERYRSEHEAEPGTYWYSRGFLHRRDGAVVGAEPEGLGSPEQNTGPSRARTYKEFVEKYGEENAQFLMETWVDGWKKQYTRAVFVPSDYPEVDGDRDRVRGIALSNGWRFEEIPYDDHLIRKLVAGAWDDDEFLVVRPGQRIEAAVGYGIVGAVACGVDKCRLLDLDAAFQHGRRIESGK